METKHPSAMANFLAGISLLFVSISAIAKDAHIGNNTLNLPNVNKVNSISLPGPAKAGKLSYRGKPLSFIENKGQVTNQYHAARTDIQYSFPAGNGLTVFVGNGAIHYQFCKEAAPEMPVDINDLSHTRAKVKQGRNTHGKMELYRMDVELVNGNKHAKVIATDKQGYYESYINGADNKKGTTAHAYNKIVYENVYPHIDWILYSANGKLKHEFKVHKGGKVSDIKLKYGGATELGLDDKGTLTANTPQGAITEPAPVSYQQDGKTVNTKFRLEGDVLSYDAGSFSGDLTIDPYIGWSTYYGGAQWDKGDAVVTDADGNIYMSGGTTSIANIATAGAYNSGHELYSHEDAFLVKFNSSGERLWGTYYEDGPGGDNEFLSLVMSNTGVLYAAGYIATDVEYGYRHFAYVAFTSDGYPVGGDNALVYHDFWDMYDDFCEKVAVDASGNVYLTGYTNRTSDFATSGAYQTTYGGGDNDAFIMKYNSSGTRQWVTYFGGSGDDKGYGIATDGAGNVYITGYTNSTSGIATSGSFMSSAGGSTDAFLAKFNSSGSCVWATYYGGDGDDIGSSVAVDSANNVYVCGSTNSSTGISTSGSFQAAYGGDGDFFLAKFNGSCARQWATYYGGSAADAPTSDFAGDVVRDAVAADYAGNVYISGSTYSTGLSTAGAPLSAGASLLAKFNTTGVRQWATYFGGSSANGLTIDNAGNMYMSGYLYTDHPTAIATPGAHQYLPGGYWDAYLVQFRNTPPPITGFHAVCIGSAITLTADTSGGTWSSSDVSVATIGSSTGVVTAISEGTVTISYMRPTGSIAMYDVTVDSAYAGDIYGEFTACAFSYPMVFSGSKPGGTWSSSNTSVAVVYLMDNVIPQNPGTATISYTLVNTCGTFLSTRVLTVNPNASAGTITGTASLSVSATTTLSSSVSGGLWSSSNTSVATVGSGSGIVSGVGPGTARITYSTTGCGAAIATVIVTVSMGSITGTATVCTGATTALSNPGSGGTWSSGNTSVATVGSTGIVTGVAAGTAVISYTIGTSTSTAIVTVNSSSASAGVVTGSVTLLPGMTYGLYDTTAGGTWSSGNTSVAVVGSSGVVTAMADGTAVITYAVSDACGTAYATATITVETPTDDAFYNIAPHQCEKVVNEVEVTLYAHTGDSMIADVEEFPGIEISSDLVTWHGLYDWVYFTNPGPDGDVTLHFYYRYNAPSSVGSTFLGEMYFGNLDLEEYSGPNFGFVYVHNTGTLPLVVSNDGPTYVGGSVHLSTYADSDVAYTWSGPADFSSSVSMPTVSSLTSAMFGTYTVSITTGAGCTASGVTTVVPSGLAPITGTATVCTGSTTTLSDISTGGTWSSSNTSIATVGSTGIVTGVAAGTARITYALSASLYTTVVVTVNTAGTITLTDVAAPDEVCFLHDFGAVASIQGGTWSVGWPIVFAPYDAVDSFVFLSTDELGNGGVSYTVNGCTVNQDILVYANLDALNYTSMTIDSGVDVDLGVPDGAGFGVWMSLDESIAVMTGYGVVRGIASGTVTLAYCQYYCQTYELREITVTNVPPVAPITGTLTVCTGATTALADTGSGTWSSSNTSIATVGSTGIVSGMAAGTAAITYTVSSVGFSTAVVTVNTAGAIYKDHELFAEGDEPCLFSSIAAHDSVTGGTWAASGAAVTDVSEEDGVFNVFTDNLGPVDISYTLNGCVATYHTTVNLPEAHIEYASDITAVQTGASAELPPSSSGIWVSYNTSIANAEGPDDIVYGISEGITMVGKIGPPCFVNELIEVDVSNLPPPPPLTGDPHVCIGTTTTLADSIGGGIWYTPNTSVATVNSSGVVTGVATGTAVISYRTIPPGYPPYVVTMVVTVNATASVAAITGTAPSCISGTGTLSDITSGGVWSSSNTSVVTVGSDSGVVTGIGAGTAIISYTVTNSCGTVSATRGVTINPSPDAGTISGAAAVCAGSTITLTDAASGGVWSSSNTAAATVGSSSGIVTGVAGGDATISYVVTNSCGTATATQAVTVNPLALAGTISGTSALCAGTTTTLTDTASSGVWSSGSPAVATVGSSGIVTGVAAGTATVSYTVTNGCGAVSATQVVTVSTVPGAGTISGTAIVCAGAITALTDAAGSGVWSSSNASVATVGSGSGAVTGLIAGTAIISYTVTNSCGTARTTKIVTVNPQPATIGGVLGLCTGAISSLTCATTGGTWSSSATGIAAVSTTGLVTSVSAGNASISYTMSNGCSRIAVVTVSAAPSITGVATICIGNTVTLTASMGGGTWASGSPSVASINISTGVTGGVAAGTANITYAVSAYCRAITPVTVSATLPAITGVASVCNGSSITLSDATTGGTWSSSNTAVATINATGVVSGISSGTVTITYATGSGCRQTKSIIVGGGLGAITGASGLCVGATTTYISTLPSIGTGWSSSNASVASVGSISGVVAGVTPGMATITFTPYSFSTYAGCVATKVVTVDAAPSVAAITGPSAVQVGHTITLADVTPGGVWNSNNTARATVSAGGMVTGISVPAATISYSVTNGACVYSVSKLISIVAARPEAPVQTEATGISVYPNPTSGTFTLSTPQAGVFTIYTMDGKEIQHTLVVAGLNQLSLSKGIAVGMYMCRFNGEDGSSVMVRLVYE